MYARLDDEKSGVSCKNEETQKTASCTFTLSGSGGTNSTEDIRQVEGMDENFHELFLVPIIQMRRAFRKNSAVTA